MTKQAAVATPTPPAPNDSPTSAEDWVVAAIKANACTVLNAGCFAVGTKLLTRSGWRAVETIRPGDEVLSRSEHDWSATAEWKRVEDRFERTGCILHVHVGGEVIRTTPEHPFFVQGEGWKQAGALTGGDRIATLSGEWVSVEEVFDTQEWEPVYNLRVADFHTYFVGDEGWGWAAWVHNVYLFRGDDNHVPGSSDIGQPIDPARTNEEWAQSAFDHVKQNLGHSVTIFSSWSYSITVAGRFATNPNRITKISVDDIAGLTQPIVLWDPTSVRDLIRDYGTKKISKGAEAIRSEMDKNKEVLIEGIIPASIQKAAR